MLKNDKVNLSKIEKMFFKELVTSLRVFKKQNNKFFVIYEPISIPKEMQPEGDAAFRKVSLMLWEIVSKFLEEYNSTESEVDPKEIEKEIKKKLVDLL